MRIAIACWNRKRFGGAEAQLNAVIPALVRAGHAVAMLCEVDFPPERKAIALPDGVPVWCTSRVGAAAPARLREWRPDLVYVHGIRDQALEEALLGIAPAVFHVHDYVGSCISGSKTFSFPTVRPCMRTFGLACVPRYFPQRCGGLNPRTMWQLYIREHRRSARLHRYRAILTAGEHMRREYLGLGFHSDTVKVVLPPFTTSNGALPLRDRPASKKRSCSDELRLLYLGRMVKLKGGDFLVRAATLIASKLRRPIRVIMAGDGPAGGSWQQLASRMEAGNRDVRYEFPGWLEDREREQTLANADILVMPSVWPEPFGLSGLEAGSYGVPAAAFAVGGIPEWLCDGVNGHLAPGDPPTLNGLAEAIVKCVKEQEHYERLSDGARRRVADFSVDTHVTRLLDVFEEVLA